MNLSEENRHLRFVKAIIAFGVLPAAVVGLIIGLEVAALNYMWEVPRDLFFLLFWTTLLFGVAGLILGGIAAIVGAARRLDTGRLAFLTVTILASVLIFIDRFGWCYPCHQFLDWRAPHLIYTPGKSFMLTVAVAAASTAAGIVLGTVALVLVRRWSSGKLRAGFFITVAAVVAVAFVWSYLSTPSPSSAAGGGGNSKPPAPIDPLEKVLLIVDDGVTWDIIRPLVQAGRLPAYRRLIQEGTTASLATLSPTVSPPIWATLATGHKPERHNIGGFINYAYPGMKNGVSRFPFPPRVMLSDIWLKLHARGFGGARSLGPAHRRVKAVWNIASETGLDVGIIGWRNTWPAESVSGFMVSHRLQDEDLGSQVHPPELDGYVRGIAAAVPEVDPCRFMDCPEESAAADARSANRVRSLKWFVRSDLVHQALAESLYKTFDVNLMAVGLVSIDALEHMFYYEHYIKRNRDRYALDGYLSRFTSQKLVTWFGDTIENIYAVHDSLMGIWTDLLGEDYALIIISDHGHKMDGSAHHYPEPGILILWGRPFRRGVTLAEASVYDIVPTVLYLLGLPIPEDMPGKVLQGAFRDVWLTRHPISTIETYETGRRELAEPEQKIDDRLLNRLKALGYIN